MFRNKIIKIELSTASDHLGLDLVSSARQLNVAGEISSRVYL